jgi:hypothetical protein
VVNRLGRAFAGARSLDTTISRDLHRPMNCRAPRVQVQPLRRGVGGFDFVVDLTPKPLLGAAFFLLALPVLLPRAGQVSGRSIPTGMMLAGAREPDIPKMVYLTARVPVACDRGPRPQEIIPEVVGLRAKVSLGGPAQPRLGGFYRGPSIERRVRPCVAWALATPWRARSTL